MIRFYESENLLILECTNEEWVDRRLNINGEVTIYRTFTFQVSDLIAKQESADEDIDNPVRVFKFGQIDGGYYRIDKKILGINYDLLIDRDVSLHKNTFVAERSISIFSRIDQLIDEPIIIGGPTKGAIPLEDFERLVKEFPTSTELRRYADDRVSGVIGEYLQTITDTQKKFDTYMKRRRGKQTVASAAKLKRIPEAYELDLEKYTYIRNELADMLDNAESYKEDDWQKYVANLFLLIYPQYIEVLEGVEVKELYSNPAKTTTRKFDLVLVNANGNVDIIEIKKPFKTSIVTKQQYRDNHIPYRELSGGIMQAEKYLFYLNKAGRGIEKAIQTKYADKLPKDFEIKIASPKAIILNGRDENLDVRQKFDFEFIRRKYSNVVDILTYDDLLRRLDNLIERLSKKVKRKKGEDVAEK